MDKAMLTEFDAWYSWFTDMLNRKPNDAEKNAIRHLLKAQLAKAIPIIAEEIFKWGKETCHKHYEGLEEQYHPLRRECPKCWQSLKERYQGEQGE